MKLDIILCLYMPFLLSSDRDGLQIEIKLALPYSPILYTLFLIFAWSTVSAKKNPHGAAQKARAKFLDSNIRRCTHDYYSRNNPPLQSTAN
jgi:hypothetical protein